MNHLENRFKRVEDVHPWLRDASIYLGFNKVWCLDYYLGFTQEREDLPNVLNLDYRGYNPVGIVVNEVRGVTTYNIFNLDDTDEQFTKVIAEIKERTKAFGINLEKLNL